MIAIGIILALTAAFVAGLVKYWGKIVEWIKKSVKKIQEVLGICIQGTRMPPSQILWTEKSVI